MHLGNTWINNYDDNKNLNTMIKTIQSSSIDVDTFQTSRGQIEAIFVRSMFLLVEQISGKIWHNRGFNDKSVKTSKIVHLDLLNKIGYGPIA